MDLYSKAYFGLLIITLIVYIIALQKNERHTKYVIMLLALWLLTSAIAIGLTYYAGIKNNLLIFHIATPLEFLIISLFYRDAFVNTTAKKIIAFSIPVFILLSIIFSVFIQTPLFNNSYILILESTVMIIFSLAFLREVMLLQQVMVLHRFPMFWISVGILFCYTGNLITEGMLNYMTKHSMELALRTYRFSFIFKYLLFILFIIGAFCNYKPSLFLKQGAR